MGILGSKKKTKQDHVFENPEKYVTPTGDEIKKAMISPQEHVEEVKTETEEYYERILRNSRQKNTALKLKSIDSSEKEGWTTVSTRRTPVFRQKLPAARDTYKARKAEDKAKKDARRTFCYADLNTVREKASLETYFGAWKQGDPGYSGEDAADDPALTEYVQGILSMELNNAVFTDDYLSDHMAEMFEYTRKLRHYTFMKQKYPNFFAHLSDDKKALLETRVAASGAVGEILKDHMKLHGLELDRNNKGFKVRMVQQTEKNNAQRERDKTKYEQDLKAFLGKNVYEEEVNLARTYTDLKSFRSKNASEELGGRLAGYKEALSSCGEEITLASGEMEKAWKVRDGLLADQKILLRHYDEEKNEVKKSEYRLKIVRNNRRIRLASSHADHYRDFLDFVTGQVSSVKRGTARFLEAENQEALLDIIRLKAMGDCLEEGFVASDKMEASRRAKELRKDIEVKSDPKNKDWEVIDYKEQSAVEANELEQFVRNSSYLSMPMDSFYALVRNYKQVKKKSDKFTSLVNKAEKNQRAGKKAASYFASTGHFDKISETDRFGVIFLDPFNEEEARINVSGREMNRYEAFLLYCEYTPGERSDAKTVQEVTEKAIKPLLDEFLAMTPEKVAGMKCPEDPDLESKEYWHNRSIVFALYDTLVNLQNLDRWNIPLSDEQRAHLIALGKVAETEIGAYQTFETQMNDPLSVLLKDDRLKGDTLNKLHDNVFFPYYDDREPDDTKVAKRIGRFGADNPGLKVDIVKKKSKQKTAIPEALGYYINGLYAQQNSAIKGEGKADVTKLYESKRSEALKRMEDARNAPVLDELKKMRQFFPEATEAEARARISEAKLQERIKKSVTGDLERLWKLNLGSTSNGAGDIRSFAIFLRPVEYTANGQVEKKSKENQAANERDIADYASGNPAYRNRVLRRIGKEVCAMKIIDEMFTLEYMQHHPEEIFEIIEKVHGLQNIVEEYADFFVSDAFTEEERDILRQRILDSKALSNLSSVFGVYKQSYLGDKSMKNVKMTDKEKLDWGKRNRDTNLNLARVMADDESELGLKGALEIHKKRAALYADKDKADRIRRASVLWAKTKSELAKAQKEKEFMSREKIRLPEGSKKARLMAKREQLVAEYEEKIKATKAKLALAEEIQNYVYEEKESLSPEAQKLFDAEAKETVIHAEYEKSYAERVEEIRADQAKTEAARKAAEGEEPVEKRAQDLSKDALFNAMAELEEEDVSEDMSGGQEIKEEIHQEDRILKEAPEQPEVIQKAPVQEQVQAPGQQQVQGPVYHAGSSLAEGTSYEAQDIQNCWACSGAALFNKFAELKDGHVEAPLNQFDIRGYEPKPEELKSLDEVNAISSVQLDQEGYANTAAELYNYMGTGKMGSGSIFEVSDFFLKKRRDFVLNQMEFRMNGGMSEQDIAAYNAQKGLFMKQVNDVLSTGNLVALYKPSGQHYLTITKIDGDMITYLDSNKPVGQMEKTEHVEMVFSRNEEGSNMSITWFSALKDPEEMKRDHPGLQYDEQQGYSHTVKEELYAGALNLAQKEGICITKSQSDPILGQDAVKIHTYIPKHPGGVQQQAQQAHQIHQQDQQIHQQMQQSGGQEKKEEKKQDNINLIIRKEEVQEGPAPRWNVDKDKDKISAALKRQDDVISQRRDMISATESTRPRGWIKSHLDHDSIAGRKARAFTGILTYFKGDDDEMAWSTYSGLMLRNKDITANQKKARTRALERIFELFLEFDIDRLSIKEPNDMLSGDFFDVRLLTYLAFELSPDHLSDYEALIDDPEADCALNAEQMKEVRSRWDLLFKSAPWFNTYPECAANPGMTDETLKDLLTKDMNELAGLGIKDYKNSKIYNSLALIVSDNKQDSFCPGKDISELYEYYRKQNKLGENNLTASSLEAIQRRAQKEGVFPKDEFDHKMTEQEKKEDEEFRARRNAEKKKKQLENDGWDFLDDAGESLKVMSKSSSKSASKAVKKTGSKKKKK